MATRSRRIVRGLVTLYVLLSLVSTVALAANYPRPTNVFYVNDYANVLDQQTRQHIESVARVLESRTSAQVVVVTINDLNNEPLEEYSLGLFRDWGIGHARENNGVLILLDISGRQSRIEVGYGLEGALPDGKTGRIQDNFMVPFFRENNFSQGITEGFNVIVNEIYSEYGFDENEFVGEGALAGDERPSEEIPPIFILIGAVLVIIFVIIDFRLTGGVMTYTVIRSLGRSSGSGGSTRGGGGSAGGGGSSRGW
ncbi:uncharacterized protein EDC18_108110 [Natranaerovirga pectinivora]|uniref:TPM domain-containing protein n=1 Tax=Natranaerovirga pectinivora TaxID=682400 RepID=A0A4V2V050_9FIRM|nr:TPM domain-containing protein [Natranaerovirga pectinivora]TCT13872.1 uncharacterized protein EDC18_108110 [Natranaerovirga pectinivora]